MQTCCLKVKGADVLTTGEGCRQVDNGGPGGTNPVTKNDVEGFPVSVANESLGVTRHEVDRVNASPVTHTHTRAHARRTHTYTHTHTHYDTHAHTHYDTHTHTNTYYDTQTTHTHAHIHAHARTHTHTLQIHALLVMDW